MSGTVSLEFALRSPIERVWQALTDPAKLSEWLMFEAKEFRPVAGHKFRLHSKPSTGWEGYVDGEVLEVASPHRLSYTWTGVDPSRPDAEPQHTTVTWTLTESEPGVTLLQLEQSGFRSDAKQEMGGARYGWMHMVEQLKNLLESR